MMTVTKEIMIDEKSSKLYKIKKNFNQRWNIIDVTEEKKEFKTRFLMIMEDEFNKNGPRNYFDEKKQYIKNFCIEISGSIGYNSTFNLSNTFSSTSLYSYINNLNTNDEDEFTKLLFIIEIILNYDYKGYIKNEHLVKRVAEAMKVSNIKAKILFSDDLYQIFPLDIEFLNKPLVTDILNWLNKYPKAKQNFQKALKKARNTSNYRNIIDDLRLSLELFLKNVFSNDKSLEKQIDIIGNYLKEHNISKEISNMYIKLIDYYTKYNDNHAKHDDSIIEVEIDYIIYLTGCFIRFIVLIEESEKEI